MTTRIHYRHTQMGYWVAGILLAAIAVLFVISQLVAGGRSAIFVAVGLALVLWLFSTLTVEVSDIELRIRFGRGIIRKTIPLTHIRGIRKVSAGWRGGLGIHFFPGGVCYSVGSPSAVEVQVKSGRTYRIGTDEPARLEQALKGATGSAKLRAIKSPGSFPPDQRFP